MAPADEATTGERRAGDRPTALRPAVPDAAQAAAGGGCRPSVRTPCLGRLLHGPWAVKGEGFAEDYKGNRDCSGEDINYQKENMFIFLLKSLPPLLFFV